MDPLDCNVILQIASSSQGLQSEMGRSVCALGECVSVLVRKEGMFVSRERGFACTMEEGVFVPNERRLLYFGGRTERVHNGRRGICVSLGWGVFPMDVEESVLWRRWK